MPGHCTFKRTDGIWYLEEMCTTGKVCPPIANYKLVDTDNPIDAGKEADFLATFKAAYGDSFTFNNADKLKVACDQASADTTPPHSVYMRSGEADREFDLKKVDGREFRQVIKVE